MHVAKSNHQQYLMYNTTPATATACLSYKNFIQ